MEFFLLRTVSVKLNNYYLLFITDWASQVMLEVKNPPASAGDIRNVGLIHGSGICPGGGHGNPLQYSCLEIPMNRGAWCPWGRTESDVTDAN